MELGFTNVKKNDPLIKRLQRTQQDLQMNFSKDQRDTARYTNEQKEEDGKGKNFLIVVFKMYLILEHCPIQTYL
jgi:hypothetical protein